MIRSYSLTVKPLRILFVGGTGTISASCVRQAVDVGMEVFVLTRGQSRLRPLPAAVTSLIADVREPSSLAAALANYTFDAVVNFLDYTAEHAATSVTVFAGRARHYVHISSAAVYHKPGRRLPYRESSARRNPYLDYATHKLDAEETFLHAHQLADFPVTIVRPAHTYDQAAPPLPGGWTVVDRLARGDEVVVHGDGTSLWTLTHARDFAAGLTGLLGNEQSIGETFHITSNFVYSWNEIYAMIAAGFGVEPRLVHLPSELLPVA